MKYAIALEAVDLTDTLDGLTDGVVAIWMVSFAARSRIQLMGLSAIRIGCPRV